MMSDKVNIYLAGAMESAGGNMNFPLFDFVAAKLRAAGFEVCNPADLARQHIGSLDQIRKMSKQDLQIASRELLWMELTWIRYKAKILVLLPGWEQSAGAQIEKQLAEYYGVKVWQAPDVILLSDVELDNILALAKE